MKSKLSLLFLLLSIQVIYATNYYVSSNIGSNSNSGLSSNSPFATIQTAIDLTNSGDTVFIMNGTYSNAFSWQDVMYIDRSGTAGAPIVYQNYQTDQPLIQFDGWTGIKIEGGISYIEIIGLTVQGNNDNIALNDALNQPAGCNDLSGTVEAQYNGNGIFSEGRFNGHNHHITIKNCTVFDCGGAGISAIQSDYITVENCTIFDNAWYSIYGNSGLTFYQLWNLDNNITNYRNIVRNNILYNNKMLVPWVDAPCGITDGNGIIIDDSRNTQNGSTLGTYTGRTLIENNVVYENGGRGIHVFESDHVDVLNNTCYKNGQSPEINDGEITAIFCDDVNIYNNILVANDGEKLNSVFMATNTIYDYNLNDNSTNYDQLGVNSILGVDPLFTDLSQYDFTLQTASPAIDAGWTTTNFYSKEDIDGVPRPQGMEVDLGAYEYQIPNPVSDIVISDQCILIHEFISQNTLRLEGDWTNYQVEIFNTMGQSLWNRSNLSGYIEVDLSVFSDPLLIIKIENQLNNQLCAELIYNP